MADIFRIEQKHQRRPYTMPEEHLHSYFEIYYLLSGERYYFVEDQIYHVHSGSLVLIPPHVVHRTTNVRPQSHERILIHFGPEYLETRIPALKSYPLLDPFYRGNKIIRLNANEQRTIEGILDKALAEAKQQRQHYELYQALLLSELLLNIGRIELSPENNSVGELSPMHIRVHNVIRFVREHHEESLRLSALAERFFVSPSYLSRVFRQVTGLTLVQYINNVRIRQAMELLSKSNLSVSEVAEAVGYETQTHFSRIFKRFMGMTPMQYRKANRRDRA